MGKKSQANENGLRRPKMQVDYSATHLRNEKVMENCIERGVKKSLSFLLPPPYKEFVAQNNICRQRYRNRVKSKTQNKNAPWRRNRYRLPYLGRQKREQKDKRDFW